jgi:hypothetical protein
MLVLVDNEGIGVTPILKDIPSGTHKVKVMRDTEVLDEREITVTAGETAKVAIAVKERPKPKGETRTVTTVVVRKSRVVPIITIGTGVAAGVTGAIMIASGGPSGVNPTYRDLQTPGYFVAAGGGVIALIGVVLFIRGGATQGPAVGSTSSGTTTVGWMGRF